jgi:hypothetical protein
MGTTCASLRADPIGAVNRANARLHRGRSQAGDLLTRASEGVGLAGVLIVVFGRLAVTARRRGSAPVAPGRERR